MPLNVDLLEQSFELVKPEADALVESFYNNLFTDYPAAKPLFEHADMHKQQQMLKGALVMVVENLRKPEALSKALKGLGARHVKYGALPAHYPLVGSSLLKSLGQHAGNAWTPELENAWAEAYGAITELMLEGADYAKEEISLDSVAPTVAAVPAPPEDAHTEIAEEEGLKVELLEQSFELVKPKADEFAESFYHNLFTDYPAAKPLFEHSDMGKQQQMLKGALVMVVENLRKPEALSKALKGLGARHVQYGALPEHYPLVGNSLLKTLSQYAGSAWTPKLKDAWVDAYGAITELMLDGADYSKQTVQLEPVQQEPVQQASTPAVPAAVSTTAPAATPTTAPITAPVATVQLSEESAPTRTKAPRSNPTTEPVMPDVDAVPVSPAGIDNATATGIIGGGAVALIVMLLILL